MARGSRARSVLAAMASAGAPGRLTSPAGSQMTARTRSRPPSLAAHNPQIAPSQGSGECRGGSPTADWDRRARRPCRSRSLPRRRRPARRSRARSSDRVDAAVAVARSTLADWCDRCRGRGSRSSHRSRRSRRSRSTGHRAGLRSEAFGPLESPCRGEASNHRKLRRSRAGVVSVAEKVRHDRIRCEPRRRTRVNHR